MNITRPRLPVLRIQFEDYMRLHGWPYVVVTEASKAVFGGSRAGNFDFLAYSRNSRNLLVLLLGSGRSPSSDQLRLMAEWETIFGADFIGVFVRLDKTNVGWEAMPLSRYRVGRRMSECTDLADLL